MAATMTTLGELGNKTLGELAGVKITQYIDSPGQILGPPMNREPMQRRAIRVIVTCINDHYNSVTHGMAHASNDTLYCATCAELLPKRDVRKARMGRAHPLNAR